MHLAFWGVTLKCEIPLKYKLPLTRNIALLNFRIVQLPTAIYIQALPSFFFVFSIHTNAHWMAKKVYVYRSLCVFFFLETLSRFLRRHLNKSVCTHHNYITVKYGYALLVHSNTFLNVQSLVGFFWQETCF